MLWKLLRHHLSPLQLAGFFLANLVGMVIVLLSLQFYQDVLPVFTEGDSFIKKDYIIVSKKISALGTFVGKSTTFSRSDISDIEEQAFTVSVGEFTPARFKVSANLGLQGVNMSTDMFFESVPDKFVDIKLDKWQFDPESGEIPIIIPRNYLNLYNFGFAQTRNLPQLPEGVMSMVKLGVRMRGNGQSARMDGTIVGFSDRLNTILVPQDFMEWANAKFGDKKEAEPSRLIVEVANPADDRIAKYFRSKGYETEDDKLDAGKTAWFLKVIVMIVASVGLLISALSFFILMLSVCLLLEKNTSKLETLLLIGYSPQRVALPYQLLTFFLNGGVLVLSLLTVSFVRSHWMVTLSSMYPELRDATLFLTLAVGFCLFLLVSLMNCVVVRRKVNSIIAS